MPGIFDLLLFVPPPDLEARRQIVRIHTRKTPLAEDVNLDEIARRTDGYTGADIASVANTAVMLAPREHTSKPKAPQDATKPAKPLRAGTPHSEQSLQQTQPVHRPALHTATP